MKIKDDLVAYLRTLVRNDFEAHDQVEQRLDESGWEGWPAFLTAAYYLAVRHHFNGKYQEAEAIRLVAEMRSRISTDGPPIDPAQAENLIKAVFDETVEVDMSPKTLGQIETVTIYAILSNGRATDAAIDKLLAEARAIAEEHI
jgi:hypothetical protein